MALGWMAGGWGDDPPTILSQHTIISQCDLNEISHFGPDQAKWPSPWPSPRVGGRGAWRRLCVSQGALAVIARHLGVALLNGEEARRELLVLHAHRLELLGRYRGDIGAYRLELLRPPPHPRHHKNLHRADSGFGCRPALDLH